MNETTDGMPLTGRRIGVPESRQLDLFADMLERRGAEVLRCPLVDIRDTPETGLVEQWLEDVIDNGLDDMIWLTGEGLRRLRGFCERCRAAGMPLSRAIVFIDTLHPIFEGRGFRWNDGESNEADIFEYGSTSTGEAGQKWRQSAFHHMLENGHDEMVIDLAAPHEERRAPVALGGLGARALGELFSGLELLGFGQARHGFGVARVDVGPLQQVRGEKSRLPDRFLHLFDRQLRLRHRSDRIFEGQLRTVHRTSACALALWARQKKRVKPARSIGRSPRITHSLRSRVYLPRKLGRDVREG